MDANCVMIYLMVLDFIKQLRTTLPLQWSVADYKYKAP